VVNILEEACLTIVNFLEIGHTQNPSNGWQLFCCRGLWHY